MKTTTLNAGSVGASAMAEVAHCHILQCMETILGALLLAAPSRTQIHQAATMTNTQTWVGAGVPLLVHPSAASSGVTGMILLGLHRSSSRFSAPTRQCELSVLPVKLCSFRQHNLQNHFPAVPDRGQC